MSVNKSYLNEQVNEFYQFILLCMVEWNKYRKAEDVNIGEFALIKPKKPFRSFIDYWCYRLYGDYGLKRRIFKYGDDLDVASVASVSNLDLEKKFYGNSRELLMQFYYDKSIPSYSKDKPICQLCRHMVFDINSMSIVSLGITKSVDIASFNTDLKEGMAVDIEEFLEGTMVIYNPRLALFNKLCNSDVNNSVDENENENEKTDDMVADAGVVADNKPKYVRRKREFQISTRKSMGTSYFNNPGFSFQDMWNDTNTINNNDFSVFDSDLDKWKQYGLVFTLQHPENRIVSPYIEKRNVLVGSYKFGDTSVNKAKFDNLFMNIFNLGDDVNTDETFKVGFMSLTEDLVESVDVSSMQSMLKDVGIEVDIPKTYGSLLYSNLDAFNMEVKSHLDECQQFDIGIVLYNRDTGMRSKMRNNDYSELLELKGSGPITISDKNKEQLFKVYWNLRQRKDGSIKRFLQIFDNTDLIYTNIFDWYKNCVHDITHKLFVEYLNAFVDKNKDKHDILFEFKPLCGELHKLYLNTRAPTTKDKVIQFVNNLPVYQVYWRIFGIKDGGKTCGNV